MVFEESEIVRLFNKAKPNSTKEIFIVSSGAFIVICLVSVLFLVLRHKKKKDSDINRRKRKPTGKKSNSKVIKWKSFPESYAFVPRRRDDQPNSDEQDVEEPSDDQEQTEKNEEVERKNLNNKWSNSSVKSFGFEPTFEPLMLRSTPLSEMTVSRIKSTTSGLDSRLSSASDYGSSFNQLN